MKLAGNFNRVSGYPQFLTNEFRISINPVFKVGTAFVRK